MFRLKKGRIFIPILVKSTRILRFSCLYVCGKDRLFDACAEIPVFDDLVAVCLVIDDDIGKSGLLQDSGQFLHGNGTGYSAAVGIFILFNLVRELAFFKNIRNCDSASGFQYPERLIKNSLFIGR